MPRTVTKLRKRALLLVQDRHHPLYLFTLTAKELFLISDISRVSRDDTGRLIGYQRPEVKRHVQDIVEYLDSGPVLFPNSLILAMSSRVHFARSRGPQLEGSQVAVGTLEIPVPAPGDRRPAWIVDGQQRALALSRCRQKDFRVPISGFVADEVDLQRDQFLRINNTKPLPRGLITELLPEVTLPLPAKLAARKIPAAICEQLNHDVSSPFHRLIRQSSDRGINRRAVITDTSLVQLIQESLTAPSGCLFPYRNIATGETDLPSIWALLTTYWSAVKRTFPEAWGKPASESRLMHGAGIRAMGRLMDRIMASVNPRETGAARHAERELAVVKDHCRWTEGHWENLGLAWNELQNVPRHIQMLSSFLVRLYVRGKEQAA